MGIDQRYAIAFKGLKEGEHDYRFAVDEGLFSHFENQEIKDARCEVEVLLRRHATMLRIAVAIRGEVVVECDRCLGDYALPVAYDGELTVKFSDEVSDYDGEVLWLSPAQDEVPLAQYIYESIVLSLPYRRVHPDGQCDPDMLGRFNIVTSEEFEAIEARAEAEEPTTLEGSDVLQALKQQLEAEEKSR